MSPYFCLFGNAYSSFEGVFMHEIPINFSLCFKFPTFFFLTFQLIFSEKSAIIQIIFCSVIDFANGTDVRLTLTFAVSFYRRLARSFCKIHFVIKEKYSNNR